ncbi:hypothetical protein [Eubacterium sp. 1001713B170207_170306_E7]|uniref:hypothetical protein n=1 Tax=Eubacterium sp. 1001713B170207_170306_E7 TaxID=2787097 RepID=UPI00189A4EE1|nr:hypothetical protein [Eubacterium sp. 1001713B170207_170306_E7]
MEPKNLKKHIEEHTSDFEKVEHTGYTDKQGREVIAEYVYTGQARIVTCKDCGGALKPKTMKIEKKNGQVHIVNGLEKPVEVEQGRVIVIYVCSRICLECATHQRIFPEGVAGWVRHALYRVWELLALLFKNEERIRPGPLKGKTRRAWETLDYYGETATLYRWRIRAVQWFGHNRKE